MEITVFNKQRLHKVSLPQLKKMAQKLTIAVIDNLEKKRPRWLKARTLAALNESASLNLVIVSNQQIKKLNKRWLGNDKVTDVLSFPLLDLHTYQQGPKLGDEEIKQELGEIFIAYEKASTQAKEFNHSFERELAFLYVHGMLHIFGFDHQDRPSEKDMFGRQKRILAQAGYPR
jgi:probable rRNA maturation factor